MSDQMDQMLDETLDDLADLPQSAPFATGAHVADMFISRDKKKPSTLEDPLGAFGEFVYKRLLELSNPTDTPNNPGDESVVWLHTKKKDGAVNEIGQGQLKMLLQPLSEKLNIRSVNDLLEATKPGIEVVIVTGVRKQDGYADSMSVNKLVIE